ncbi:hypothetical protein EV421DRAFT_1830286, partial [Armillaria borealis]
EVVECFRQVFEGIQFMQQHLVAHRDCTLMNIMLDPTKMYPKGFLPERPFMKLDFNGHVSPSCTRTACWPRYYLMILDMLWILRGADKTAPGHCNPEAPMECIPFPTDIYYLGCTIGLDFLRPLVEDMVKENPSERPTIDDVNVTPSTVAYTFRFAPLCTSAVHYDYV